MAYLYSSMQKQVIYIHLKGYLGEWLVNRFGYPVKFPSRSWENIIIARNLAKKTLATPEQPFDTDGLIPVVVPSVSGKVFTLYNHFPHRAEEELLAAIESLFRLDMYYSLISCVTSHSINDQIDAWCGNRGIIPDHREAVRQKFYRIRRDYEKNGVILRKKYIKKLNNVN